jgi:response regulator NasT
MVESVESASAVGALRLVVAEDEAVIRMDLVEMLTELGYEVVGQAADGARAVELVRTWTPDVVLLDINMPVMDGLTAASKISSVGNVAIVMVTAFSQRNVVESAVAAGAHGYLVKPFTQADLVPTIELAVAQARAVQALAEEAAGLRERSRDRELVDEAKVRLQASLGVGEAEAFALLRRAAMDARITLAEAAARLLEQGPGAP